MAKVSSWTPIPGFVGEILVENNTVYGNGSAGIESFRTNDAVITENTVYGNNTANVLPASVAEIFINQSNNNTVTNNITTAPDLTPPTISSLIESPSSGDLNAGKTVTFTLTMSEAVTVGGGTPTLTLNDGGTATYTGGSGSNALTFSYTVGAGQNTAALAATAVNLNSATVTDGAGNAANLSLSGLTQSGPQIDTTTPTIASLDRDRLRAAISMPARPSRLTLNLNEAVTVRRRHADAHPQRRRHRHLYRRLRQQCTDLQLHRGRRTEHRGARRHRRQSQLAPPSPTAPAMPPISRSPA